MDQSYWIGRMESALEMARGADSAEMRLSHYERAGRCSVRAARAGSFLLPRQGPATEGEREALRTPRLLPDGSKPR